MSEGYGERLPLSCGRKGLEEGQGLQCVGQLCVAPCRLHGCRPSPHLRDVLLHAGTRHPLGVAEVGPVAHDVLLVDLLMRPDDGVPGCLGGGACGNEVLEGLVESSSDESADCSVLL